jgi:chromosome segregation ATPase
MNKKKIIKKLIRKILDLREEYADLEFKHDKKLAELDSLQYYLNDKSNELQELEDLRGKYDDLIYDHRILEDKVSDLEIELDDVKRDRDHYEDLAREHLSEHFI